MNVSPWIMTAPPHPTNVVEPSSCHTLLHSSAIAVISRIFEDDETTFLFRSKLHLRTGSEFPACAFTVTVVRPASPLARSNTTREKQKKHNEHWQSLHKHSSHADPPFDCQNGSPESWIIVSSERDADSTDVLPWWSKSSGPWFSGTTFLTFHPSSPIFIRISSMFHHSTDGNG